MTAGGCPVQVPFIVSSRGITRSVVEWQLNNQREHKPPELFFIKDYFAIIDVTKVKDLNIPGFHPDCKAMNLTFSFKTRERHQHDQNIR
ncbi:MAG: hypothetical protein CVU06_10150 [Bacteroidetes bacterium HGW-Bacteroidetes-22]|nr:MAG: hypothetical protein CVU06_10150 [Bacteroidetes bacterium HGW-Bacteroidetes-22]